MFTKPALHLRCILQSQHVSSKAIFKPSKASSILQLLACTSSSSNRLKSEPAPDNHSSVSRDALVTNFMHVDAIKKQNLTLTTSESIAKPGSDTEPVCSLPNKAAFQPVSSNTAQRSKLQSLMRTYAAFSKFRLSALVVATSAGAYLVAPGAFDPVTFAACCGGTLLLSSSANTWNQLIEVNADGQMKRTSNRPLVTGNASRAHACSFAVATALGGASLLAALTNEVTLALGVANLLLYVCAYTPMKRIHFSSMYIGALVGAIPPLMGWAAATGGSILVRCGTESATGLLGSYAGPLAYLGALVMPIVLFSWQFPHFNALSWNQRDDYARAGYRIMASECPARARLTALTHSAALTAICLAAPLTGVTTPLFALITAPVNAYLVSLALRFRRDADSQSSRRLFRFSLLYLPIVLIAMLVTRTASNQSDLADEVDHCAAETSSTN